MAHAVLNIPSEPTLKTVTLKAATGKGDAKKEVPFEAELPASLADAIAKEGEKEVFKRYINSLVISLQANKRSEIATPDGADGKPGRKRASYMEELGI